MSGGESWHEERDRLERLLKAIKTGNVTHIDADGSVELQAVTPDDVPLLEKRLATLNDRIGN